MTGYLYEGDCLTVLPTLDAEGIDACITDPPYELNFMERSWDRAGVAFSTQTWREVFRVLKPGAHLLAMGGTRTYHRLVCAVEDAGFEIRDTITWLYGQGFPKSLDVSKAIDKAAGIEREVVGTKLGLPGYSLNPNRGHGVAMAGNVDGSLRHPEKEVAITAPATAAAAAWDGWGTALKPAAEMIVVARKPISEASVAANVLRWGTGALNIDGARVEANGRWPANVALDEPAAVLLDEQVGERKSGFMRAATERSTIGGYHGGFPPDRVGVRDTYGDSGGVSRFFYVAKASTAERSRGLDERNRHPTVKPLALMTWLVQLVTPPGGIVLDPFLGSGTTAVAARNLGFSWIGIERETEYVALAEQRIEAS